MPMGVGIFYVEDLEDLESIRYVFMNKVVLHEMRKTKKEVFGKTIKEVAPEAFQHEGGRLVMETYRKVAAEGGSVNLGLVEYSNHMVAGTYECSVHAIKKHYVYVLLRNVTELEQTKLNLEKKNQELSQFAYIVSHDLKEPLRTVTNYIDVIQEDYQDKINPEDQNLFKVITSVTKRMHSVITDLLSYSQLGEGKTKTSIDCKILIQEVLQDLGAKIQESGAEIQVGSLPIIEGYSTELRLLFQNLIGNAIKYSKPGLTPNIEIKAEKLSGWTFYIEDNGIGIDPKHQDKIFSVFQRLHQGSQSEGSGIGLAHCKKIVDLHQGEIGVESKPGAGSTFWFTLPPQPRRGDIPEPRRGDIPKP